MLKTALAFADDDSNGSTTIGAQAAKQAKFRCHVLAQDDPSTVLRAITSLKMSDQHALSYLRAKALRFQEISRRNRLS